MTALQSVIKQSGPATGVGLGAVLLWSSLAVLTSLARGIPPFELLALSFGVAFLSSLVVLGNQGAAGFLAWRQPWTVWAWGFAGIFVYHALYFFALKAAPPAEASLIAYLWPLFIVVMSGVATGERVKSRYLAGAALGLCGTALIVVQHSHDSAGTAPLAGYAAALGCALVWSTYSIINRRFRETPSHVIGGVCGLVALAGAACHVTFEETVWPDRLQWAALVGLGVGPVGAAFFAWDHATKYGRLPVLGVLSYFAPLLSTLLLIAFGQAKASPILLASAALIIAGAIEATAKPRLIGRSRWLWRNDKRV